MTLAVVAALAVALAMPAQAVEVGGVKVADTATVGGKTLPLNGAGMRQILFIKVYAAGLYLTEKKTSTADVMALTTPKRIALHVQREINSDEFGQLFITSMNKHSTKEEKAKVINQTVKFGETLPDIAFYNAVLRIWLGESPAQGDLKKALLGEK